MRHEIEPDDGDGHSQEKTPGEQETGPLRWGTHLNGPPESAEEECPKQNAGEQIPG
jgi:hypothetical protein